MNRDEIEKLLDGTTPGPWFLQDFTAPEVNDNPTAGDVYVSCTWPDHIPVASMGGGFEGYKALYQARKDAALIAAAPKLAHTALDALARLEDAEAAQALVVERAVDVFRRAMEDPAYTKEPWPQDEVAPGVFRDVDPEAMIRALASPSGVEALAALRAERDEAKRLMEMRHREMLAADGLMRKHQRRAEKAEADRDRLAAANAALEAQVARLVEAAEDAEYDLLQWLECSKSLTAAGFNMDGTAEVTSKLTAAISHIKRGKTNG